MFSLRSHPRDIRWIRILHSRRQRGSRFGKIGWAVRRDRVWLNLEKESWIVLAIKIEIGCIVIESVGMIVRSREFAGGSSLAL